VGPYLDVVQILDDLGTQDAPWLRPEMYRRLVKPYHAKFIAHIKNVYQAAVMFHSDGAIFDLIPDLIEMGVDILNPVQYSAQGMDLRQLKQDFGNDITFWGGGIDTQHTIRFKPTTEIEDEVKRN
jgi:uroporphyrinogen decarboxylase